MAEKLWVVTVLEHDGITAGPYTYDNRKLAERRYRAECEDYGVADTDGVGETISVYIHETETNSGVEPDEISRQIGEED
jgi:hypothetical protein